MRDGFASGSLSLALSALIAAVLFLSLPTKADRNERAESVEASAPVKPQVAPAAEEQPVRITTGAESVVLPPPPVIQQTAAVEPPVVVAESPRMVAEPTTVPEMTIEPLQPTAPEAQQSPPDVAEPLRPSTPVDPVPETVMTEPLQPSAINESEPLIAAVPVVEQSPEPAPVYEPVSQPASAPLPNAAVVSEGRVLLRILEHGSGPVIEIAWPQDSGARRQLFQRFQACFGMELALMDEDGSLFIADGIRGQKWDLSLDRYSGFVRQTSGRLTADEDRQVQHIRAFHGGLVRTASVRIFPRKVDAILLGGLRQLIGGRYEAVGSIHASYRMMGNQVLVEVIVADGEPIQGHIELSSAARSSCRNGSAT